MPVVGVSEFSTVFEFDYVIFTKLVHLIDWLNEISKIKYFV